MASIARGCDACKKFSEVLIIDFLSTKQKEKVNNGPQPIICPHCLKEWGKIDDHEKIFERCPICGCRQFYLQKDFNQALGCLIMLVGIILVPWTYGLSLPVFAACDWILHKRVPSIAVCYKCLSEFRGFKIPERFKPFMHHIGAKYDK